MFQDARTYLLSSVFRPRKTVYAAIIAVVDRRSAASLRPTSLHCQAELVPRAKPE